MSELDKIAIKYGTDKSSKIHDYCYKYEKYLPFKRDNVLKILEIGVYKGNSLKMWGEYFYNSEIIGIDIDPSCAKYGGGNIKIEIGSQNDEVFLSHLIEKYGEFDMIVDDGSHNNSDVIFSFNALFKSIKSNGVYIVEDTVTSYWDQYGGGRYKSGSTIEHFKKIIDEVNFFGELVEYIETPTNRLCVNKDRKDGPLLEQFKKKGYGYIGTQIESINFLNSIILITKR